ncbi:FMN-dependent NADH-azoreductase [Granulicella tundricola]|uniref:FMN dependent NADH:quinone oxidoreductase n=1 Tax=Granulicella tundricola (strain ATCC BAA-1859 / DSM 23138 / MP5ACTX9) TaxID=1198114 RepID=E8WWN5_GRATM|nr:NAD(P)H-dependent oxidoreductase [Granulicella tundricola]ADW70780.1 NAD(P)H dehydrogenase (quinone) [Granulicella tundricola MP5ACTX9]
MASLLSIESSPRGEYSISRKLTSAFVEEWQKTHAGGTVVNRDLFTTTLPFVDLPWIAGAYTPAEQHSPEMKKALEIGNTLIAELKAADHIVLGTSMYNFSTPAILKAYIDQIVRVNVTFTPQYEGLVKGKKLTIILASGGVYTPGSPTEGYNAESSYLKQVFGFIGITDVNIVLAGGTGAVSMGQRSLEDFVAEFTPAVLEAAK